MSDTTSATREDRRGRKDVAIDTPKWVAVFVIGAVVILALQVGGLKGFVQH